MDVRSNQSSKLVPFFQISSDISCLVRQWSGQSDSSVSIDNGEPIWMHLTKIVNFLVRPQDQNAPSILENFKRGEMQNSDPKLHRIKERTDPIHPDIRTALLKKASDLMNSDEKLFEAIKASIKILKRVPMTKDERNDLVRGAIVRYIPRATVYEIIELEEYF
jgi:hypothetical protein